MDSLMVSATSAAISCHSSKIISSRFNSLACRFSSSTKQSSRITCKENYTSLPQTSCQDERNVLQWRWLFFLTAGINFTFATLFTVFASSKVCTHTNTLFFAFCRPKRNIVPLSWVLTSLENSFCFNQLIQGNFSLMDHPQNSVVYVQYRRHTVNNLQLQSKTVNFTV